MENTRGPASSGIFPEESTPYQQPFFLEVAEENSGETIGLYSNLVGGGFKHFLFSPLLGKMIQFD